MTQLIELKGMDLDVLRERGKFFFELNTLLETALEFFRDARDYDAEPYSVNVETVLSCNTVIVEIEKDHCLFIELEINSSHNIISFTDYEGFLEKVSEMEDIIRLLRRAMHLARMDSERKDKETADAKAEQMLLIRGLLDEQGVS